jgi:hypothetical protein
VRRADADGDEAAWLPGEPLGDFGDARVRGAAVAPLAAIFDFDDDLRRVEGMFDVLGGKAD